MSNLSECTITPEDDPVLFFLHKLRCTKCTPRYMVTVAKDIALNVPNMSPRDAAIILETEMAVEVKAFEMTAKSLQIRDKPHKTRDLNDQHNVKKFRSSSSLVAARKEYSRKLRRLLLEKDRILYDLELKQICQESEDTTIPDSFTEAEEEKGNGKQEEAEEKDVADSFGKMKIN